MCLNDFFQSGIIHHTHPVISDDILEQTYFSYFDCKYSCFAIQAICYQAHDSWLAIAIYVGKHVNKFVLCTHTLSSVFICIKQCIYLHDIGNLTHSYTSDLAIIICLDMHIIIAIAMVLLIFTVVHECQAKYSKDC